MSTSAQFIVIFPQSHTDGHSSLKQMSKFFSSEIGHDNSELFVKLLLLLLLLLLSTTTI